MVASAGGRQRRSQTCWDPKFWRRPTDGLTDGQKPSPLCWCHGCGVSGSRHHRCRPWGTRRSPSAEGGKCRPKSGKLATPGGGLPLPGPRSPAWRGPCTARTGSRRRPQPSRHPKPVRLSAVPLPRFPRARGLLVLKRPAAPAPQSSPLTPAGEGAPQGLLASGARTVCPRSAAGRHVLSIFLIYLLSLFMFSF